MLKGKKSVRYIFFIFLIYMLIFQNFLQMNFEIFKYFDELLALAFFPIFLLVKLKSENKFLFNKNNLKIVILLLIIIVTGLLQNIKYEYQLSNYYLTDLLIFLKFFLVYFLSKELFDIKFIKQNKKSINMHVKIIAFILLSFSICNYLFVLFPAPKRFGIMVNQLFFEHPTYLAGDLIFLLVLYYITSEKNKFDITILYICILICSTLRIKAIGGVAIAIMIIGYCNIKNKKITFSKLSIFVIIAVLIGIPQLEYYFSTAGTARKELLEKSIDIAKDYFPFGTGFGTYGTFVTGKSYSPIYYMYGLSEIWGLTPESPGFVSDGFWYAIIGQFGFLGLICYLSILYIIIKRIQREYTIENKKIYAGKVISMMYLLICSTSEAAFFSPIAIPLALIIGVYSKLDERKDGNVKNN